MVSLTDDDKTQLGQLTDYLFSRQATIVDRWLTECSLDEAIQPFINRSREVYRDQCLLLFHIFIQRITGGFRASDLIEKGGQINLNPWQGGYSLAEWIMAVDIFYSVLDEQIQQFLELHPQTNPWLITQVYSQLHRLLREVNRDSITYIDQVKQTEADEQIQTLRVALYSLQQLSRQRVNHLQQVAHDLRSSYGILSSAASLLQRPLKDDDRAKFIDMLNRNVNIAQQLLDQLMAYAQSEEGSDA